MKNLVIFTLLFVLSFNSHAQNCNSNIPLTSPDSRFTVNSNGTVQDKQTGLIWQRCSAGQSWDNVNNTCSGDATTYTWKNALIYAQNSTFAEQNDWRLPNIKELESIVELACYAPAINETLFPNTALSYYWTVSANVIGHNSAWIFNFDNGYGNHNGRNRNYYVRLARGGQ